MQRAARRPLACIAWLALSGTISCEAKEDGLLYSRVTGGPPVALPRLQAMDSYTVDFFESMCGVTERGAIVCWGGRPSPKDEEALGAAPEEDFVDLTMGNEILCALHGDGLPTCWMMAGSELDVPAQPLRKIGAVMAENYTGGAAGLALDDRLVVWGEFIVTNPPPAGSYRDLCAGFAIDEAGALRDWQGSLIDGSAEYVQVACDSDNLVCGLLADGGVQCHAPPAHRRYIDLMTRSDAGMTEIDVGDGYVCGLTETRELECWGHLEGREEPFSGEIYDIVAPEGQFASFATGPHVVCGSTVDGELRCAGSPWW